MRMLHWSIKFRGNGLCNSTRAFRPVQVAVCTASVERACHPPSLHVPHTELFLVARWLTGEVSDVSLDAG